MTNAEPFSSVWRDPLVRGATWISSLGFLGFLIWAAFIPLDEGVSAHGTIIVENNRQVVQHLEGGIIAELNVREGQTVEAGAPLIVLQGTSTLARRDQVLQSIASLRATEIRLEALRADEQPDFSPIYELGADDEAASAVIERQQRFFENQVASLRANLDVLEARRRGALETITIKRDQIGSEERALQALSDQLETMRSMYMQQMARLDQLRDLERQIALGESTVSRLSGEQSQARTLVADQAGQIAQARAQRDEQIGAELVEVRENLLEAEEELLAAQDALDRSVIYAPQSGEVINMKFSTEGGVVRSGEPILEIVPSETGLVAAVRIRPIDRARVFEGQQVRAQLSAYQGWTTPRLTGEVIGVSADLKRDQQNGDEFYEARVRIPQSELASAGDIELMPGMPVSAFIFAGTERTTLEYLFEPISESVFRGLRGA
ncbi:HlyD family type I secretion periplasmic adaptor subunit [Maricaulaceae bacterium EIL42A08]|nr:HlyD family type I secretion periplasmic adaptor subunit [Maricaulaceae bacterium EIL42A08]